MKINDFDFRFAVNKYINFTNMKSKIVNSKSNIFFLREG